MANHMTIVFDPCPHTHITVNKEAYVFLEGAESKGIQCDTAM